MEFTIYGGCICPLCGWVMEITSGGDMMRCGNGSCELRLRRFARPTVECREIDLDGADCSASSAWTRDLTVRAKRKESNMGGE